MKSAQIGMLAVVLALLLPAPGLTQESKKKTIYSYATPFYCGESDESFQEGVVAGTHSTSINIHNPSLHFKVAFSKLVTRALPFQRSGTITQAEEGVLNKNEAITVECNEIRMRLPASMTSQFRSGFLVVRSKYRLNVTAIFSSRPGNGEVSTIDVESVSPTILSREKDSGHTSESKAY